MAGSINGFVSSYVFKVNPFSIFHKTIAELDSYIKDIEFQPIGFLKYRSHRVVKDTSNISSRIQRIVGGVGAEEYAISGYF